MKYADSTCGGCSYWEPVTDTLGVCQARGRGYITDGLIGHTLKSCAQYDRFVTETEMFDGSPNEARFQK